MNRHDYSYRENDHKRDVTRDILSVARPDNRRDGAAVPSVPGRSSRGNENLVSK
jgi:hypothetical protein